MTQNKHTIEYDITTAAMNGVQEHPQKNMEELGMKVVGKWEGATLISCIFAEVENVPENLPPYIKIADNWKFDGRGFRD